MITTNTYKLPELPKKPTYKAVLSVELIDNAGSEIVDLDEVKLFGAIDGSAYDTMLISLITTARIMIEKHCNVSLMSRQVIAKLYPGTQLPYMGNSFTQVSMTDIAGNVISGNYADLTTLDPVIVTYDVVAYDSEDFKTAIKQQVIYMYENRGDSTAGIIGLSPMVKSYINSIKRLW